MVKRNILVSEEVNFRFLFWLFGYVEISNLLPIEAAQATKLQSPCLHFPSSFFHCTSCAVRYPDY